MGFGQGLSGLEASSQQLSVIGNNVANASTVGFKASETLFSDVYANSLEGSGANQVGIGVQVAGVEQQFTQGNITASSNPLDIAINGGGFYILSHNGTASYSRNGQFQLDKNGYITNAAGDQLQGYSVNSAGVLSTGSPTSLQINTANIAPQATANVAAVLNLDAQDTVPTVSPFDPTNPLTYNNSSSVTVYDTEGVAHTLQTYYVYNGSVAPGPNGNEAQWTVYATVDGNNLDGTPFSSGTASTVDNVAVLAFSPNGTIDNATTNTLNPAAAGATIGTPSETSTDAPNPYFNISATPGVPDGATTPMTFALNLTGTTQYGAPFSTSSLTQDGFTSGQLSGFSASANGTIVGTYTNGQSKTLGQIALASFTDPNGLQSLGNNEWAATATSGAALVGVPGTGLLGVLQSSATEDSNVDLTSELVNMITAQENYQANAQTVKTENDLLQTLVTLR
jgi:flagellar hook protein FlgE